MSIIREFGEAFRVLFCCFRCVLLFYRKFGTRENLDTYENIKCVLSKFGKVSQKMRTIHNLVIFHNAIGSQCTHVPKVWCVFMFSRWFCEDTSEYILGLSSAKKFIVT